jgi:hypothetical protein
LIIEKYLAVWLLRELLVMGILRNFVLPIALLAIALLTAVTHGEPPRKVKRALPPKWTKAETDVFFPDAREKLVGKRPDYGAKNVQPNSAEKPLAESISTERSLGEFAWSKLISAETIEDEVKSLQKQVGENVTTPAKFKGGGFKAGRAQFTELALLFGIIAEYDGDVRWKEKAAAVRDLMARAGQNCKVGTDASFTEAKLRKEDLEQLVQGGGINAGNGEVEVKWAKIADRPPLMQRLEQAQQHGIAIWTANSSEFSKNSAALLHEAELIAAIAQSIQQEGYEFADDDTYQSFARQMQSAALDVVGAVKGKNYQAARAASGNIEKACSACHEGYRS